MKCHVCDTEIDDRLTKPGKLNDDDLFVKLFHGGLTHDEIASVYGVSRVAVTNRVKKLGLTKLSLDAQEYEARLSEELMDKIQIIMKQITADKIHKASLAQLGTLLGILYDKRSLHERRGTAEVSYVGHVHKFDKDQLDQLKQIMHTQTQKRIKESQDEVLREIK
jgi:transposase